MFEDKQLYYTCKYHKIPIKNIKNTKKNEKKSLPSTSPMLPGRSSLSHRPWCPLRLSVPCSSRPPLLPARARPWPGRRWILGARLMGFTWFHTSVAGFISWYQWYIYIIYIYISVDISWYQLISVDISWYQLISVWVLLNQKLGNAQVLCREILIENAASRGKGSTGALFRCFAPEMLRGATSNFQLRLIYWYWLLVYYDIYIYNIYII